MSAQGASEPTISIVTACYNSVPFLDRLHRSLKAQTNRSFEWICVDDCSTDDTVERLLKLESPGALGMQVYRLPQNTGGPVALAVGTQHSSGDIVVWLDHDDEMFPFALEQIRLSWSRVLRDARLSGLFFRATDPITNATIGRKLKANSELSWSELTNRFPDVSDGTIAIRGDLLREFATVESMEGVALNGAILNEISAARPLAMDDGPPIRFYHRDNPESQTRFERISRKTVETYARILDGADAFYLLDPARWVRHIATMLRYSKSVHDKWFECLNSVRRPSIRMLAYALWPLGWIAWLRAPHPNIIRIPHFPSQLAEDLPDLWRGQQ